MRIEEVGPALLINADCRDAMRAMDADSIDAVVTDPPYGLTSARPTGRSEATKGAVMKGFMGLGWDHGVPGEEFWVEALRVAKPGAHLLAFGGTRTFHRLAVAIEDAGWEIRDCIGWIYAQGFPKSQDVGWEMHKKAALSCGAMVEYDYDNESTTRGIPEGERGMRFVRATYLQTPVYACAECGKVLQPFVSEQEAQSLRSAWSKSETIWPEQPRMEGGSNVEAPEGELQGCSICSLPISVVADGAQGWVHHGASDCDGQIPWQVPNADGSRTSYRPQSRQQCTQQPDAIRHERAAQKVRGWGTALKPAWEPVIVARKPLIGTVAANVQQHGTGAINIDGCRIDGRERTEYGLATATRSAGNTYGEPSASADFDGSKGRWPANFCHDSSDEVLALFPDSNGSGGSLPQVKITGYGDGAVGTGKSEYFGGPRTKVDAGSGSAARFFYSPKCSKKDRNEGMEEEPDKILARSCQAQAEAERGNTVAAEGGAFNKAREVKNNHPTVKPTELMRYLCRLVTPPGGTVLDPFMGSGSTGKAALKEGFGFVGIDNDEEHGYFDIACARVRSAVE